VFAFFAVHVERRQRSFCIDCATARDPPLTSKKLKRAFSQLYVRRVFITDDMRDMVPSYLSFVYGVVSLPLGTSSRTVADHHVVEQTHSTAAHRRKRASPGDGTLLLHVAVVLTLARAFERRFDATNAWFRVASCRCTCVESSSRTTSRT